MRLAIVVPALNEAERIEKTIQSAQSEGASPAVYVVDGGSQDATENAAMRAGARVLRAPRKGRGVQMNIGWQSASQDCSEVSWFLFLHGDSLLPQGYMRELAAVMDAQQSKASSPHEGVDSVGKQGLPDGKIEWGEREDRSAEPAGIHRTRQRSRRCRQTVPDDNVQKGQMPLLQEQQQPPPPQQQQPQQLQGVQHHWLWPWQWAGGRRRGNRHTQPTYKQYGQLLLPFLRPRCHQTPPMWGCFRSIHTELEGTFQGRILSGGVALRTRLLGMPYGDQGIFVHRSALMKVGGFKEWPLLEDVDMCRRLHREVSPPAVLPLDIQTSGRRWLQRGFWRNAMFNQVILGAWALGFDPHVLARWYYRKRE